MDSSGTTYALRDVGSYFETVRWKREFQKRPIVHKTELLVVVARSKLNNRGKCRPRLWKHSKLEARDSVSLETMFERTNSEERSVFVVTYGKRAGPPTGGKIYEEAWRGTSRGGGIGRINNEHDRHAWQFRWTMLLGSGPTQRSVQQFSRLMEHCDYQLLMYRRAGVIILWLNM